MANASEGNLKWMYEGKNSSIDHEQYLLGKRITTLQEENEEDKGDFMPKTESSIGTGNVTVLEKLDYESKVREDPLFEIRKKEFQHRKELLSNPLKKKRIQTALKRALEKDLKKSLARKKKKRASSSESEDSTESSSSDSDEVERKLSKKSLKDKHLREVLKKKLEKDLKSRKQAKSSSSEEESDRRKYQRSKEKRSRRKDEIGSNSENKEHSNKKSNSIQRKNSSSSRGSRSPTKEGLHKKEGYGLINVKGKNTERKQSRRRERRTPTPEPEKPRYVRKHKTGFSRKLSERDLEKRRREMMENANWRDDQRKGNIKKYSVEEKKEKEREEKIQKIKAMADEKGVKTKDFLHDMKLQSASVGSLSDTVRRKKHTLNKRL